MRLLVFAVSSFVVSSAGAADPFFTVAEKVNPKVVKLFGAGGFRGVANYGSGILISPDGHILTAASQMLDSAEIVVHLNDGRKMKAVVLVTEPELDSALLTIKVEGKRVQTFVNGKMIVDYTEEANAERPPAMKGRLVSNGTFAIQGHDPESRVVFKNIKVRVLP